VSAIQIDGLSREELASLIGAAVTRWLLMMPTNPAPSLAGPQDEAKRIIADDEMLKVEEAAALIRRTPRWINRHVHKLPFVVRISPKALLYSKRGIQSWLTSKPANQYFPSAKKREVPMVKLTVRLPDSLARRAKIQVIKRRTKFQVLIARALETFLKSSGREGDVQ
jgi:hypothetical protein